MVSPSSCEVLIVEICTMYAFYTLLCIGSQFFCINISFNCILLWLFWKTLRDLYAMVLLPCIHDHVFLTVHRSSWHTLSSQTFPAPRLPFSNVFACKKSHFWDLDQMFSCIQNSPQNSLPFSNLWTWWNMHQWKYVASWICFKEVWWGV